MADIGGLTLTPQDREALKHPLVGGLLLFARNYSDPQQLKALCAELLKLKRPRLLLAVDHEGGRVQRFRVGFTRVPAMRTLGRLYEEDRRKALAEARRWGRTIGKELAGPIIQTVHGLIEGVSGLAESDVPVPSCVGRTIRLLAVQNAQLEGTFGIVRSEVARRADPGCQLGKGLGFRARGIDSDQRVAGVANREGSSCRSHRHEAYEKRRDRSESRAGARGHFVRVGAGDRSEQTSEKQPVGRNVRVEIEESMNQQGEDGGDGTEDHTLAAARCGAVL